MINWQLNTFAIAMFVTAAIAGGLVAYIWRQRPAPGATPLALLMLGIAEWSFGYAMELGSPELGGKLFWTSFNFIGIVSVPTLWLVFALEYTNRQRWLTRRNLVLLAILPIIILGLAWTNDLHHFIRSKETLDLAGPIPMFDPTYSGGFWVWWAASGVMVLLSSVALLHKVITSPGLYRSQAAALLVGALVPWVGNLVYLSGHSPLYKFDLTPFTFAIAGLAAALGIFRYRLLDIVPVARDAVIESMSEGVVVLDAQARVVDVNQAAEKIIGCLASEVIGQAAAAILSRWPSLAQHYGKMTPARENITWTSGETQQYFDLSISPLFDRRGRFTGQLVVFRDITERERLEAALRASYAREQEKLKLSDTLRQVAKIVSSTLERQKVLDLILAQLEKVIIYHRATVMLLSGDKLSIVAKRDRTAHTGKLGSSAWRENFPVDKYPLNAAVLLARQPLLLPDVALDERWQAVGNTASIRSYLSVPLLVQDRPIGILSVGRRDETPYTEDDAQTVFAFGSQVAVALEQARLHEYEMKQVEREMEIAQQIQLSLLPLTPPQVPGLDISGFSQPARHVGGDFYSYFVFGPQQLGVAVGDVSGKGMQAALMMALSVGLLTTEVRREAAPGALLVSLNRELRTHTQRSKLNTALGYLVLKHTEQGWQMQVSNAGVIAPLVRRSDGSMEWMNVGGLPLGTMDKGKEYEQLEYTLSAGDVMVLSSDGIVEAMNEARELYGFERFTTCLAQAPQGSAQEIQDYILADMRAFSGQAQMHDDVTLVVAVIVEG